MPQKIHFRVIQSSSADDQHPASALNQHGLFANGWQSSRSCSYPQELILKFEHHLRLKRVQLLSHQYLIASKIEFLIGSSASERRLELERIHFTRLGYIDLSTNERTDFTARELKSIHVDADGLLLKLIIHKNYTNRLNVYDQVSIVAINLLGDDIDQFYDSRSESMKHRSGQVSVVDDLAFAMYQDPEIATIIKNLDRKKQLCVQNEQFDQARKLKQAIHELVKIGERLACYEMEKRLAIQDEDYETAQSKKDKMEYYRAETYKQLQALNLLDLVIAEGGHSTAFLKRLQERDFSYPSSLGNLAESPEPVKQHNHRGTQSRSSASPKFHPAPRPDSTSPLPPIRKAPKRMSIAIGTDDRAGYITPEFQKPSIRYEDKIIPTLRHRIQADANIGRLSRSEADLPRMMSTVPSDDVIPELNQAEIIEANQMMTVFDQVLVAKLYHRNHAEREEALDEIYRILSRFSSDDDDDDAAAYLRASSFVVARMLRMDVFAIFSHSLKIFHLLMNDFVRRHSVHRQDVTASLERILPVLLQRTGDSNARIRQRAQEAIVDAASYPELKPLQIIPHHCVYPFNNTCAPRLATSRCELVEELMKKLDANRGENGLNVENVSKFWAQAFEHNAGEVREIATRLLLSLYRTHGNSVKRALPPDNDQTRRIKKYRDLFDAFDRIDEQLGRHEESIVDDEPFNRSKRASVTSDSSRRDAPRKQHTSRDPAKSFDSRSSTQKSRTPTRFDRKTPTNSVADESEFTPENTCIFCGEKNDAFLRNGLETHYWASCPMLRRCQECNQVVEIGIYTEHLLRECAKKSKYQQCPRCTEAIGHDFDTHVRLKECSESKPHTSRCPLCHSNVRDGDKAWRDHLTAVDGCAKNPRRLQALKRHQQERTVVIPPSQVNGMKKPKKATVK